MNTKLHCLWMLTRATVWMQIRAQGVRHSVLFGWSFFFTLRFEPTVGQNSSPVEN